MFINMKYYFMRKISHTNQILNNYHLKYFLKYKKSIIYFKETSIKFNILLNLKLLENMYK